MLSNHLKKFGIDIDNLEEFDEMFDFTLKKMGDFNFEKPPLGEETFISDNPSDIIPDIIIVLLSGNMWHDKLFRNITRAFREYFLLPNIFPLPENQWEELHEIHRRYSDGQQFEPETTYDAKYPSNHVFESEAGHIVELDDTSGAAAINEGLPSEVQ